MTRHPNFEVREAGVEDVSGLAALHAETFKEAH